MGGEVTWSSLPRASVRKHFSVSVYMRAALAGLARHLFGTAIRARPHLPGLDYATPGLDSDICWPWCSRATHLCGTLQRAPHSSLDIAWVWSPLCTGWWMLRVNLYSPRPKEVAKHYSSQPGPNTLGTAVLPWALSPRALTTCLVFPLEPRLRSA